MVVTAPYCVTAGEAIVNALVSTEPDGPGDVRSTPHSLCGWTCTLYGLARRAISPVVAAESDRSTLLQLPVLPFSCRATVYRVRPSASSGSSWAASDATRAIAHFA